MKPTMEEIELARDFGRYVGTDDPHYVDSVCDELAQKIADSRVKAEKNLLNSYEYTVEKALGYLSEKRTDLAVCCLEVAENSIKEKWEKIK